MTVGLSIGINCAHVQSLTLSLCPCGQGWDLRWASGPVLKGKQFYLLMGWGSWSSSARGSGKEVQRTAGHCLGCCVGSCGRGASECPALRELLQFDLA